MPWRIHYHAGTVADLAYRCTVACCLEESSAAAVTVGVQENLMTRRLILAVVNLSETLMADPLQQVEPQLL